MMSEFLKLTFKNNFQRNGVQPCPKTQNPCINLRPLWDAQAIDTWIRTHEASTKKIPTRFFGD